MKEKCFLVELYFPFVDLTSVINAVYANTTGYVENSFSVVRLEGDRYADEREKLKEDVSFYCGCTLLQPERFQVLSFPLMDFVQVLDLVSGISNQLTHDNVECYVSVSYSERDAPLFLKNL